MRLLKRRLLIEEIKKVLEEVKDAIKKVAQLEIKILTIIESQISVRYPIMMEELVVGELQKHFDNTIEVNKSMMRELHMTFEEMINMGMSVMEEFQKKVD